MKRCGKCSLWKNEQEFSPRKSAPDGLRPHCRECIRAYERARYALGGIGRQKAIEKRRLNQEGNRDATRRWREKHRKVKPAISEEDRARINAQRLERKRASRQRTYRKNKEKVLAVAAKYRTLHKDEERAARRAHYVANKERNAIISAVYRKANLKVYAIAAAKRRAAKLRATPAWANEIAIAAFYAEAARLTKETGIPHEVDHIVPLQSKLVCGLHCEGNLRIVPREINRRKSSRWSPDMDIAA